MSKKQTVLRALDLMRAGSVLVKVNGDTRRPAEWYLAPGGAVTEATAKHLVDHPQITGQKDTLFPGMDQTWRMIVGVR